MMFGLIGSQINVVQRRSRETLCRLHSILAGLEQTPSDSASHSSDTDERRSHTSSSPACVVEDDV